MEKSFDLEIANFDFAMTKACEYPRVLVVDAAAMRHGSASGTTMVHLFRDWPADRLAQVYHDYYPPDPELCPHSWLVSSNDIPLDRAVRKILGKKLDKVMGPPAVGLPPGLGAAKESGSATPRSILRMHAGAWADLLAHHLPRPFWDWVAEFRPDVLYSTLGGIRFAKLALAIGRFTSCPLVPHFMDDWPTTHYASHIATRLPRWVMLRCLRKVFSQAPLGMTISEAMAEEYGRRYGLRFEDFMNCASVPAECPPLCDVPPGSPLKLVYVGGLHLNRWQAIRRIGEALDQLAEEGIPAELEIHAPETDFKLYAPQFEGIRTIRSGGSLTQEQIPAALRDADVLVHVESFDDASRRYTRLSISTKIPQYLAAGRPIFGYGPMEVASCGYLQSSACGVVVGVPDPQKILETLRTLLENSTMRRNCGRRAWEQACRRHDEKAVRERFRALLAEAAQPSKRTTR